MTEAVLKCLDLIQFSHEGVADPIDYPQEIEKLLNEVQYNCPLEIGK